MEKQDFLFKELNTLAKQIKDTEGLPDDLEIRLNQMLDRLDRMANLGHYASEFDTLARYIETVTTIPWVKETKDILDLERAKESMERNHYGMQYTKDRILEYLSTLILLSKRGEGAVSKSPVLLLVGLQGVGKTTLAYSLAETLGRKFERINVGVEKVVTAN